MSVIHRRPDPFPALSVAVRRAVIILMIWPLPGLAQDAQSIFPDGTSYFDWLDKPRDYLSERFVSLSTRVDRFFADERVFQESRTSYLRFYGDLVLKKSGSSDFNPQLQAKVVLPALEKRLHILLESNSDVTGAVPTASVPTQSGAPKVNVPNGAGNRYATLEYQYRRRPQISWPFLAALCPGARLSCSNRASMAISFYPSALLV